MSLANDTQMKSRQGGFTLLEMLVAIAIFASLSMGAYQVLQGVLTSDEVAKKKEARLSELQLAFTLMERDITQMVPRSGRIDGENNKVLLAASRFGQQSDDWGMAFIRGGWLNPDGMLPRSGLQRVGWRLKDHKLERLRYLYPDPVIGTEPRIQPMLDRVTALRLYFYDKGAWRKSGPSATFCLTAWRWSWIWKITAPFAAVPHRGRWPASRKCELSGQRLAACHLAAARGHGPAGGAAHLVGNGDHRQQHERSPAAGAAPYRQPHRRQAGLVVCHVGGGAGEQGAGSGFQG